MLNISSVSDLGGLGARTGVPVSYNWTGSGLIQPMLPWLCILLLLALKPNRTGRAWWILAPLLFIIGTASWILPALDWLPSELLELFSGVFTSLTFGLATVWLLATYLARKHRFVTLLCLVPTLAVSAILAMAIQKDWSESFDARAMSENVAMLVILGISIGVCSLVLFLAGLITRRRWRPVSLTLLSLVMTVGLWLMIAMPFFIFAMISSGRGSMWKEFWKEFIPPVLSVAGICFAILMPFLVLSFTNSLFRDRLMRLLHIAQNATPCPPMPPSPPATSDSNPAATGA